MMSHFFVSFKAFPGYDFGKCVRDRGSKIDTEIALYGNHVGNLNILGSVRISGAGMKDPNEIQRYL